MGGPGSSVGIKIDYGLDGPGIESWWGRIFRKRQDQSWGPPSLLYNGYGSFPAVKRPGRGADHPPLPSAEVENEKRYTSTPPLGPWWPVIG
jgi:hypothetical protein